jgi:hypothetical protein
MVRIGGWPLLIASLVLPVAAGSVSLWTALGDDHKLLIAGLSFGGAAAVALHKGLNCEAYQGSLKRTAQLVRGITEAFEAVEALPDAEVADAVRAAEASLRELRAKSTDLPPKRRRRCRPTTLLQPG